MNLPIAGADAVKKLCKTRPCNEVRWCFLDLLCVQLAVISVARALQIISLIAPEATRLGKPGVIINAKPNRRPVPADPAAAGGGLRGGGSVAG